MDYIFKFVIKHLDYLRKTLTFGTLFIKNLSS